MIFFVLIYGTKRLQINLILQKSSINNFIGCGRINELQVSKGGSRFDRNSFLSNSKPKKKSSINQL